MRTPGVVAVLAGLPVVVLAVGDPVSADSLYALKTTTLPGQPADLSYFPSDMTPESKDLREAIQKAVRS
jgi:hypothetical protein